MNTSSAAEATGATGATTAASKATRRATASAGFVRGGRRIARLFV